MASEAEAAFLAIMRSEGPCRCAYLGMQAWQKNGRKPQSYARPAGKVLRRMERKGWVCRRADATWVVTAAAPRPQEAREGGEG